MTNCSWGVTLSQARPVLPPVSLPPSVRLDSCHTSRRGVHTCSDVTVLRTPVTDMTSALD